MHYLARRNNTLWVNIYFLILFMNFMTGNLTATTEVQIDNSDNSKNNASRENLPQTGKFIDKNETIGLTQTTYQLSNTGNSTLKPEYDNSSSSLNLNNSSTSNNHVVTTPNITGSTELDDGPHPSVNLAIIPALAILIFLIIFCIRCCKWLRVYTKGEDKDESSQYATILHVGDEEYGQVDVTSDTASTANNDTVSSYCSFLTRSANDTPVRLAKGRNLRLSIKGDPQRHIPKLTDSSKSGRKMIYAYTPLQSPGSFSIQSDPFRKAFRNQSVSSSEIESPNDSVVYCNENVQIKRLPKSRVSFKDCSRNNSDNDFHGRQRTIDTSTSDFPSKLEDNVFNRVYPKRVSVRATNQIKFNSANCSSKHSPENTTPVVNKFPCLPSTSDTFISTRNRQNKPTMVCVGVQTDKSFRYSLYKRRRPLSDPGHRDDSLCETLNEEETVYLFQNKNGKNSKGKCSVKKSRNNNVKCSKSSESDSKRVGSMEFKNENASEENLASTLSLSDADDDVFVQSEEHSLSDNSNTVDTKTRDNSSDTKTSDISRMVADSCSSQYSKSNNTDKELYRTGQNGTTTSCSICKTVHPYTLTSISKCIDHMTNSLADNKVCEYVEKDKNSHNNFLHNCDNLFICDQCLTKFSKKKNGIIHAEKSRDSITDVVTSHDCGDYIITGETDLSRKDFTSSMTSLESSGYAEISSESSGSP